jgi:hypothetical protein
MSHMEDFAKVWRREQIIRRFVEHCLALMLIITIMIIFAGIIQYFGGIDTLSINDFFMGFK